MGVKDIFFPSYKYSPSLYIYNLLMMSIAFESSLVILLVDFGPSSTRALKEKKKKINICILCVYINKQ
jgi:hypothetical protein